MSTKPAGTALTWRDTECPELRGSGQSSSPSSCRGCEGLSRSQGHGEGSSPGPGRVWAVGMESTECQPGSRESSCIYPRNRPFPRPQMGSRGNIPLTTTFGAVPRLQPQALNIGSDPSGDSSTGRSPQRCSGCTTNSLPGSSGSSFPAIPARKTKFLPCRNGRRNQYIPQGITDPWRSQEGANPAEGGREFPAESPASPSCLCIQGIRWCRTSSPRGATGGDFSALSWEKVLEAALDVPKAWREGRLRGWERLSSLPGSLWLGHLGASPRPPLPRKLQQQLYPALFWDYSLTTWNI